MGKDAYSKGFATEKHSENAIFPILETTGNGTFNFPLTFKMRNLTILVLQSV